MKFKAAILTELKKDLLIEEISLVNKLQFGQILVEVSHSGICGSQLGEIDGVKGPDKFLPHLLGHEGSGIVREVGPNVTNFKIDDHVVLHWRPSVGIESNNPQYKLGNKKINAGLVTTFNEYAVISENRLTKIPKEYPLDLAPLYGCAITTGFGVIENNAQIKMGQSLVVFGSGGVGLNIIQAAKLRGAFPIIAVDLYDKRLELAQKFGADYVFKGSDLDILSKNILSAAGEDGIDVIVDNTGLPEIISKSYELTKPKGKIILVGVPRIGQKTSIYTLPIHFGKKLIGSHGGEASPHEDISRFMKIEERGYFNASDLVTDFFDLDQINLAIKKIKDGTISGRCILKC